jgi:hypothetical protein
LLQAGVRADRGGLLGWAGGPAEHGVELGRGDEEASADPDGGDLSAGDSAVGGGAADAEQFGTSVMVIVAGCIVAVGVWIALITVLLVVGAVCR